jgi:DNA polymerase III subunit epsilon
MNFVVIDFETANQRPSSACQLGAVVVRDGRIIDEWSWLIRPPSRYFSRHNIAIHGIHPEDVEDAPDMEQVWSELQPVLEGQVVVAHNARFDLNVLIHSLASRDVACPGLEFQCTRVLARAAWPGRSSYGLKPLGTSLGIDFKHHDALEDARCCAQLAIEIGSQQDCMDLSQLEELLQVQRGVYRYGQLRSPRSRARRRANRGQPATGPQRSSTDRWGFPTPPPKPRRPTLDCEAVLRAAGGDRPLRNKHLVFLGPLQGLTLEQTCELVSQLGGNVDPVIGPQTHYVIACGTTLTEARRQLPHASHSTTTPTAVDAVESTEGDRVRQSTEAYSSSGVRLLSERQFLALLPGGQSALR